jgi:uncharacterized protein (TIGR03435 family)
MSLLALFCACACFAQSEPRFDVASVRLADPAERGNAHPIETAPGRLTMRSITLFGCLAWAWQMPAKTVGPDWLQDVRLDIDAKAAGPVGDSELSLMLRTLLHERMGVAAHMEKREMDSFALTVAKSGAKLTESNTDGPPEMRGGPNGAMVLGRMSMRDLARFLTQALRRPTIDATGLTGHYDLQIDWTRYLQAPEGGEKPSQAEASGAMISALKDELGIQIEDRKALIDTLVVERAERVPTVN